MVLPLVVGVEAAAEEEVVVLFEVVEVVAELEEEAGLQAREITDTMDTKIRIGREASNLVHTSTKTW